MSLFQCEHCGCVENTALSAQGFRIMVDLFDWTGIEDRKGKQICSACGPTKFRDGEPTKFGTWHNQFKRTYLPLGLFKTNRVGNLEHIETGEEDYRKYEITSDLGYEKASRFHTFESPGTVLPSDREKL